jgi:hypothetical protein
MRITQTFKLTALSLALMVFASACGDRVGSTSDRISGTFSESTSERLSARADDTIARLQSATEHLELRGTETVTLQQLQDAGIPVGSRELECDDPLDLVLVEGIFDREDLFPTGVAMAGGSLESLAMRMVAEIYDPETDMPLGMIGDETGGQLTSVTQSGDGSIGTGSIDGSLMLGTPESPDDAGAKLIPEATCQ